MNKKQVIKIVIAAVIVAFVIAHFGFHDKIWHKISPHDESVMKKNKIEGNQLCFSKELDNNKRIIVISTSDKNTSEFVGGDVFFKNGKIENNFIFQGNKKNDILNAFGDIKNISNERVYKISNKGIIEGKVEEKNIQTIAQRAKTSLRIKDISKVIFDEKLLIERVDCDNLIR